MKIKLGVKFTLCSPDDEGSLDYTSSVILFNAYSAKDRQLIRSALKPSIRKNKLIPAQISAYNLTIHEYTHYLDLTTTVWGMEFLCRRSMALSKILAQGKSSLSVAMLNAAEILMHNEFKNVHRQVKLENLVTTHSLKYSERHGTVIIVYLSTNNDLVAETSVSMLSILEANAISNEFEGEFQWVACTKGGVDVVQNGRIEAKFSQLLEDSSRLEYNIFHIIVATHFSEQSLRHRLKLVSTLCHLALDISADRLAVLANKINDRIQNIYLGDSLCNDLCRGMSRQIVAFYLVLVLYEYINREGLTTEQIALQFESSMNQLIEAALIDMGVEYLPSETVSDMEYLVYLKALRKERDKFILPGSIRAAAFNRKTRKTEPLTSRAFRRLKLPDIILDDHSKVRAPTRIRSNVLTHWDNIYEECSELDDLAKDPDVMKKFHMPPNVHGPMQERRRIHLQQILEMEYQS